MPSDGHTAVMISGGRKTKLTKIAVTRDLECVTEAVDFPFAARDSETLSEAGLARPLHLKRADWTHIL